MSARRHRPERVTGLEVWDVMVGAQPLHLVPSDRLPSALVELVRQLRAGSARREQGSKLPRLEIERVVLGGGAPLAAICAELVRTGVSTRVFADPLWIAEPGGRALLSRLGMRSPCAVLDVGQSSLKLSIDGARRRVMRPMSDVPLELDVRTPADALYHRSRTLAFFASTLALAAHVHALVLALPCEIADDLTVAGCSYPWPAGDASLVHELLHATKLAHLPCLVLNDAELAALSVSAVEEAHATLVLTVGLGVGAAYVAPA